MAPDGSAGQWVIEYFKDTPTEVKEKGRRGMGYPFHRVVVTAKKGLAAPEVEMVVPGKLYVLKPEYIAALDDARKLAIDKTKAKFEFLSVISEVKKTGEISWKFRFYHSKSEDIVDKVNISADGKKQLPW